MNTPAAPADGSSSTETLSQSFRERLLPRDRVDWLLAIPLTVWIATLFCGIPAVIAYACFRWGGLLADQRLLPVGHRRAGRAARCLLACRTSRSSHRHTRQRRAAVASLFRLAQESALGSLETRCRSSASGSVPQSVALARRSAAGLRAVRHIAPPVPDRVGGRRVLLLPDRSCRLHVGATTAAAGTARRYRVRRQNDGDVYGVPTMILQVVRTDTRRRKKSLA